MLKLKLFDWLIWLGLMNNKVKRPRRRLNKNQRSKLAPVSPCLWPMSVTHVCDPFALKAALRVTVNMNKCKVICAVSWEDNKPLYLRVKEQRLWTVTYHHSTRLTGDSSNYLKADVSVWNPGWSPFNSPYNPRERRRGHHIHFSVCMECMFVLSYLTFYSHNISL